MKKSKPNFNPKQKKPVKAVKPQPIKVEIRPGIVPESGWPKRGECCWPMNNRKPWSFCCNKAVNENYCEEHTIMSINKK